MWISKLQPLYWCVTVAGAFAACWAVGFAVAAVLRITEETRTGVATFCGVAVSAVLITAALFLVGPKPSVLAVVDLVVLVTAAMTLLALGKTRGKDLLYVKQRRHWSKQSALHVILLTGVAIFSVPFLWMLATSLKEDKEASSLTFIPRQQMRVRGKPVFETQFAGRTVRVVAMTPFADRERVIVGGYSEGAPKTHWTVDKSKLREVRVFSPKWDNYAEALRFLPPEYKFGLVPLWNTVYVSLLCIIGTVLSSSLVAYSFARLRWPGRDILFVVLLATMMLPAAVTMLPVFLIFRTLGWVDTLRPLWIGAFFGGAFNVFLLRQFFLTIPNELEDAAKIDGCSFFGIYWRIMLPLIKPALAALTIMSFMGAWNNFMGPLIYISSPEKMPLAYALQLFQGAHGGERPLMMAASTLVMLPVLTVFFFTQRYFIQGITLTGMKA